MTTGHAVFLGMFLAIGLEVTAYCAWRAVKGGTSVLYNKVITAVKNDLNNLTPPTPPAPPTV